MPYSTLTSARVRLAALTHLAVLLVLLAATPSSAQLVVAEEGKLRLVYFGSSTSFLVPHATRAFLNSLEFQREMLGFESREDITVFLADFSDKGNAGAFAVPRNAVIVQLAPLSFAFETFVTNERLIAYMNHELVHVATMDQATGADKFFRRLFRGKVAPRPAQPETILYQVLTSPRADSPRWYFEGSAVFLETWMAAGLGRAQSGYYEMVFRSMVHDGTPFYDPLGLVSEGTKIDFQVEANSYLYGTRFFTFLADRYSPEQVLEWISRRPGSRANYSSQFEQVFDTTIDRAWAEWVTHEQEFQQKNLETIRKYPITPYQDVSPRALGSVSRAYYDPTTKEIYAAVSYQGAVSHVAAIPVDGSPVRKIVDIKGPSLYTVASLAWDPDTRTLFYTKDNGQHRSIMSLDPATGRQKVLLDKARIGELAFNRADRSLWGVRVLNGLATIVRVPHPYNEWKQIATMPYGTVVYDLDVSPDGSRLSASFGEIDGKQNVRLFETTALAGGNTTPAATFDFAQAVPSGFTFSGDGRFLYGSAYYTGVSNIFRYEIATKDMQAVSNTDTGFFRPIPLEGEDLLLFRYTGQGFVPARIAAKPLTDINPITFFAERVIADNPVLKTWAMPPPSDIVVEDIAKRATPYPITKGLSLESVYPIVQGYKDTQAVGVRADLSDPLGLNALVLTASYSPGGDIAASERVHLKADYRRYDWRAHAELNNADFYDLFGPTKVGRKGYVFGAGHHKTLIFDEPRRLDLDIDGRVAGNLDRLPQYQNIAVDVSRMAGIQAKLSYFDVVGSIGKVDDEKGTLASAVLAVDRLAGQTYPRVHATFDRGFALPLPHSSIWVRSATGASSRPASEPFSNFYFGGFGNNWVDYGDEKRYRAHYSFPGVELNEVDGRNFVKSLVEWNLPPKLFSRMGVPSFYLTWARPAVFAGVLGTNLDAPGVRRVMANVGGQIDFRFIALSNLDLTLSIGGAAAFEEHIGPRREFMVSLKILR